MQQHLRFAVKGIAVEFSDAVLMGMTDTARVRKIYKLNAQPQAMGMISKDQSNGSSEEERKELEVMVLGLMALRAAN